MDTELFYQLWEKFSQSDLTKTLPDDVIAFCEEQGINLTYFIEEFI
jgi:hypothetical protein